MLKKAIKIKTDNPSMHRKNNWIPAIGCFGCLVS
jgi:hypothetical protein